LDSKKPTERRRIGRTGLVGILLSLVLLWWVLHDIEFAEVAEHLRTARLVPFIACVVAATVAFPLRTIRWRYLLQLDGEKLPFVPLWHATAIGFMANNLLPARAGEVARAYAAKRLTGVPFMTAATTLAVERVMDGLTLVALLAVAMLASGFGVTTTVGVVTLGQLVGGFAVLFLGLLIVAVWAVHWPDPMMNIGRRTLTATLPAKWADKAIQAMLGVFEGLGVLREWKRFGMVALWSFVVWGVNGLSFLLCMVAFDLQAPWMAAFVLQSLIAFGVAMPQGPAYVGIFEAVTRATLVLYGVTPALAVSYAVAYHFFTFIPITALGLWSLSRAHLHLADLRAAEAGAGGSE
jgi:uncharacterized protein (TIRG00374 family)